MMLDLYQQLNEKDDPVYLDVKQFSHFVYAVGSVKNRDFGLLWKHFDFFFFLNYDKVKITEKRENWNDILNALSKEYTSIGFCQL